MIGFGSEVKGELRRRRSLYNVPNLRDNFGSSSHGNRVGVFLHGALAFDLN
jgi:hypothetical protein